MRGPFEAAGTEGTACSERPHLAQRRVDRAFLGAPGRSPLLRGRHKDSGWNNTRERKLRYCPGWQSADTQLWHG